MQATWEGGGSALGRDGAGSTVFEPRNAHKGDCARAMFYFAIRYESILEQYRYIFDPQEYVLRAWNRQDLPDEKEVRRNDSIEQIQLKRNPFIDCPEVVDRIPDF
jgi:endonuclease I